MNARLIDQLRRELPVRLESYTVAGPETGLVLVNDPGSPECDDADKAGLAAVIGAADRLARRFAERRLPVLAFAHAAEPEGDPGHLYPELAWLKDDPDATVIRTSCVNGFVAGIEAVHHGAHGTSRNRLIDWVNAHRLRALLVGGVSTDRGVLELVLSLVSARRHGLMTTLRDIVVVEPTTAARPPPDARANAPASTWWGAVGHHVGLSLMAARGAIVAGELTGL